MSKECLTVDAAEDGVTSARAAPFDRRRLKMASPPLLGRANLTGLVLGCIEAKFCKKICVGKLSPRSTQCTPLHRSQSSKFCLKIAEFFAKILLDFVKFMQSSLEFVQHFSEFAQICDLT